MIRTVVLDITGNAMQWLDLNGDERHMEICEVITLKEDTPIHIWELTNYDNWDILLVFEMGVREKVRSILRKSGIPENKVIYPFDIEGSMIDNIGLATFIFNQRIQKLLRYISYRRDGNKYNAVTVGNMSYINTSSDDAILPGMVNSERNWAQDEMRFFYRVSQEYYSFDEKQDIFCDIGANIGTTCLYFKKELDPDVTILAFEPSKENYKMLQINAILNDISPFENMFVPMGVSDKKSEGVLNYNPKNPGGSTMNFVESGIKEEDIKLTAFDDYLEENNIDIERIKYFWVDVEGHEARFLKGARKTLSEIKVPFFMEFVPRFYMDKDGEFELLMNELEAHFNSYICAQHPENGILPLQNLWQEKGNTNLGFDLFLLK